MSTFPPVPHLGLAGLALCAALLGGLVACKPGQMGAQPGKAFLDSQIPPGLSPQYYPPPGFVWGAFKAGSLPEARYGVASPPVNPAAQVLILADADYPAEVYFETARQLLSAGYGVWILEAPGQGGSGRYRGQKDSLALPDYRHTQAVTKQFVSDVVHPSPEQPLYILGTGYSAVTSLALSDALRSDKAVAAFLAFDPYAGTQIDKGVAWTRSAPVAGYWGGVAQPWQLSNPDLRLRVKSEGWIKEMGEAQSALGGVRLPAIALGAQAQELRVLQSRSSSNSQLNAASRLCSRLSRCKLDASEGPQALGTEIARLIAARAQSESSPAG